MRSHRPQRIFTELPLFDFDAGEAIAIDGKTCDFFFAKTCAQRQTFKGFVFLPEQTAETPLVLRLDVDDLS